MSQKQRAELLSIDRLVQHQLLCQRIEERSLLLEHVTCQAVGPFDQPANRRVQRIRENAQEPTNGTSAEARFGFDSIECYRGIPSQEGTE